MHPVCLFDMDGLLLDTERVFLNVAVEMLTPLGYEAEKTEQFFRTLVGSSGEDSRARLTEFLGTSEKARKFYAHWYDGVIEATSDNIALRPTVADTLETLKQRNVRMAVVTSTKASLAERHLSHAGLREFFEVLIAGDHVPATKPDPAPYLAAAAKMDVRARDCYAFEDSDAGITSAMAAGCRGVQIPDLRDTRMPLPSLGQLIAPDLKSAVEALGLLPKPIQQAGYD